ncbi:hypothetical protein PIB30_067229 [Stylosanthes scabra]|uniref:Uncharacterized protein n=1 Tax=Stylosanthes scabra TaxID=79078 RepID=A0ABU6ULE3_9FABA|nr:hypothetical protein [Stylosanthes scabra]
MNPASNSALVCFFTSRALSSDMRRIRCATGLDPRRGSATSLKGRSRAYPLEAGSDSGTCGVLGNLRFGFSQGRHQSEVSVAASLGCFPITEDRGDLTRVGFVFHHQEFGQDRPSEVVDGFAAQDDIVGRRVLQNNELGHDCLPGFSRFDCHREIDTSVRFDEIVVEPHDSELVGFQVVVLEFGAIKRVPEHDVRIFSGIHQYSMNQTWSEPGRNHHRRVSIRQTVHKVFFPEGESRELRRGVCTVAKIFRSFLRADMDFSMALMPVMTAISMVGSSSSRRNLGFQDSGLGDRSLSEVLGSRMF